MTTASVGFGDFVIIPSERRLLRSGAVIEVGSRAFDILLALIEADGGVVSRQQLLEHAWPGIAVGEGSLRVTIAGLRKALGDGQGGNRYIVNFTGRGYCFVAPLMRLAAKPRSPAPAGELPARSQLPPLPAGLIGRDEVVAELAAALPQSRFVTVVGPGGMGKTTVAIAAAHASLAEFAGQVFFVDLAPIADATLLPTTIATALDIMLQGPDQLAALMALLEDQRLLLVLDNCEHVLDGLVPMVEKLRGSAPQLHLLATSREAMRATGETVHLLAPLASPPISGTVSAEDALQYPAVRLFMARAAASGHTPDLADDETGLVALMCHRLDGIALAIELAAGRVGSFGLEGTAELLDNRFGLLWHGRRTALPRHHTMSAVIDWSFNLLSERDRRVLSGLSVFVGSFSFKAIEAVIAEPGVGLDDLADAVQSLVDKSLIDVPRSPNGTRYRLLELTRAHAAQRLAAGGEARLFAVRHAAYLAGRGAPDTGEAPPSQGELGDIRAALEWSFSPAGDAALGVRLAKVAPPLLLASSQLIECRRWCDQALALASNDAEELPRRLSLQAALATSAMFTQGNTEDVRRAIEDGLASAEAIGDAGHQMTLLAGLHIFLTRVGEFRATADVAQRALAVAQQVGTASAVATAQWMLGCSYHLVGEQQRALWHCRLGFEQSEEAADLGLFGYDHRVRALIVFARALWLSGRADEAAVAARGSIAEAEAHGHPVNLCIALIYSSTVFLWRGDTDEAKGLVARLLAHAGRFSLGPYQAVGSALEGELAVAQGQAVRGVPLLRRALSLLQLERHNVLTAAFDRALCEGLLQLGELAEAGRVIEAALQRSREVGEPFGTPELLRLRGEVLWRVGTRLSAAVVSA